MIQDTWIKDPDDFLDYTEDWSDWLEVGDTIDTADVEADDGITVTSVLVEDTRVTAWVQGGTAGTDYDIGFRITTTGARIADRTITLLVRQR